jgi:ABC-type multidrug transport system fused ATPase/permease subunit
MSSAGVASPAAAPERLSPSVSLEEGATWFAYIFMTYLDTLFAQGATRALEMGDLGPIASQDKSDVLYAKFCRFYGLEMKKPAPKRSLLNVLCLTCGYWKFALAISLFSLYAALQFGPVFILTRLVRYFQGVDNYTDFQLWVMVSLLLIFPIVGSILLAHSNAIMAHLGCQFRNVLIGVIYRKSLVISPYQKQSISSGRIITMFSADTNMIRQFLFFLANAIVAPLQIGTCIYLIYRQVGVAAFVGLGYTFFTMPISGVVFGIMTKLRRKKMVFTDSRVKLMNEILSGIRIIKYYAWEKAFVSFISEIRANEIKLLAKSGYIFNFVFGTLLLGAPQIQTVLVFFTYIMLGNQLDAATAFTTLTLFGLMTSPFIFLPFGIQQLNTCQISMARISEFLEADELQNYITYRDLSAKPDIDVPVSGGVGDGGDGSCPGRPVVIEFANTDLSWTPQSQEEKDKDTVQTKLANMALEGEDDVAIDVNVAIDSISFSAGGKEVPLDQSKSVFLKDRAIQTLQDINLKIHKGDLVVIVGPV